MNCRERLINISKTLSNELVKARLKDPLDTIRLTVIEELSKFEADELQEANKLLKLYSILFDSLRDVNENVRRKSLNFLYTVLVQYDHMKNFKVFDLEQIFSKYSSTLIT
jgi:hypothetical protein